MFLGWFSFCLAEWTELWKPDRSCAFNWRGHFQSGALKDSKPLRFLLDNLFSSVRVALFGNPCVWSVLGIRFVPTYLPTDTTTL